MATFTVSIPDAVFPRVLNAIANQSGWTVGTGLTKGVWAARWLESLIQEQVIRDESEMARAAKQAEVEAAITVTVT